VQFAIEYWENLFASTTENGTYLSQQETD